MTEEESFRELMRQVRARDERGAAELVRCYTPRLLTVIRIRLTDPRLRRLVDATDICQSVLAIFFDQAARGRFQLDRPEQLRHLLATMARHEVTNQARKQCLGPRGRRPRRTLPAVPGRDPSEVVADRELADEFSRRLSADEKRLAEHRAQGRSWHEIAAHTGSNADAVRMRFVRALRRIATELRLDPPTVHNAPGADTARSLS